MKDIIFLLFILFSTASAVFWHVAKNYENQPLLHAKATLSNETYLNYYNRLPESAKANTRPSIWAIQQQPAGMFLQFQTNSSSISVNYTLGSDSLSQWHFPSTGVSGMDLYAFDETNKTWRWTGTSHPKFPTTTSVLASRRCSAPNCATMTYRVHLCTYNHIADDFAVGVSSSFDTFVPDSSHFQPPEKKSIVWYGSSILQGAVASRPGQIMTHQVSRNLETLIYNFGFSGNCFMETSVAQYLVNIKPIPSLWIIDCNPNMNYTLINDRAIPLIHFIRSNGHPTTPIIMTEGTKHGGDWYSETARVGRYNKTIMLRNAFNELVKQGDDHLYYSTSTDIYSSDLGMKPNVAGDYRFLVDPTVGGTHPTDLGMRKQATYWTKKIPAVLAEDLKRTKRPERIQRIRKNEDKEIAHLGSIRATFKDQLLGDVYNMQPSHDDEGINEQLSGYKWIDGSDILHGFSNFKDGNNILKRNSPYNRLPSAAQADVRPKVWELSQMSTGMYLRFTTNASDIAINHTLAFNSQNLWHMPKTGTDGLDIYAWSDVDQSWRHVPVTTGIELDAADGATMSGVFHMPETANKSSIITHWTYLIYLPLRNAPKDLKVGVPSDSYLCKTSKCINDVAPKFNSKYKPIVWYGTSIQQGGVASRAGNEYDAIISRALSVDIHNFGFAGNGIMELSVAKYLSMVDAEIIVIDCLPNMNAPFSSPKKNYSTQWNGGSTLPR
jgi:hypothetical protein